MKLITCTHNGGGPIQGGILEGDLIRLFAPAQPASHDPVLALIESGVAAPPLTGESLALSEQNCSRPSSGHRASSASASTTESMRPNPKWPCRLCPPSS